MKKVSLKPYESRILKVIETEESSETIAKKSNLSEETVNAVCESLRDKGLIKIESRIKEFAELTIEGEEYVKFGLPERRILKAISKGIALSDLSEELSLPEEKVEIGIGWLRKKSCIEIKEILRLTNKGKRALKEKWLEEIVLERIAKEQPISVSELDKEIIDLLKNRNLVKVTRKSSRIVSLTKKGKDVVRGKIKIERQITKLSSDLIISGKWREIKLAPYDVSLPSYSIHPGKKHFMRQILEYIRRVWVEMGFKEMEGPMLETSFWNFDALYQPGDHPARDLQDTFYMKTPQSGKLPNRALVNNVRMTHEFGWDIGSTGWQCKWDKELAKRCILRTHTTSLSARTIRTLKDSDLPAKFFAVGRCFRNETPDWKHLAEFYQTEGIVVDENANFRHLLGYLREFFSKLGFKKARFRPSYFPYTEESTEIEIWCPVRKDWIELGGSGIFRPEVVKPLLGKVVPVLAWGLAVERLVMLHYDIKDIRVLYWNDLEKLRSAKIWLK